MRPYPEESIGPFEPPSRTVTDAENREIRLLTVGATDSGENDHPVDTVGADDDERVAGDARDDTDDAGDERAAGDVDGAGGTDAPDEATPLSLAAARESLAEMYEAFDPADRAQGIPPTGPTRIQRWLDEIVTPDAYNVVARHDGRVVGHATLVPSDEGYELAIFVLSSYQGAGVGTALLTALLGAGGRDGVERVWLSVERWNRAAVGLYEKLGFETSDARSFELEMSARLASHA